MIEANVEFDPEKPWRIALRSALESNIAEDDHRIELMRSSIDIFNMPASSQSWGDMLLTCVQVLDKASDEKRHTILQEIIEVFRATYEQTGKSHSMVDFKIRLFLRSLSDQYQIHVHTDLDRNIAGFVLQKDVLYTNARGPDAKISVYEGRHPDAFTAEMTRQKIDTALKMFDPPQEKTKQPPPERPKMTPKELAEFWCSLFNHNICDSLHQILGIDVREQRNLVPLAEQLMEITERDKKWLTLFDQNRFSWNFDAISQEEADKLNTWAKAFLKRIEYATEEKNS